MRDFFTAQTLRASAATGSKTERFRRKTATRGLKKLTKWSRHNKQFLYRDK
jgi:hypothetical protein